MGAAATTIIARGAAAAGALSLSLVAGQGVIGAAPGDQLGDAGSRQVTFTNVSGTETTCTLSGGSLLTELEAEDEQKRFEARSQTSVGPTEDPNCGASSTKVEVSYADPYGNRRRGSAFAGNGNIATWESDAVGAGTYTAVHEVDFSRCNHLLAQDCTFQVTTTLSPK